jgi:hypothetical protein
MERNRSKMTRPWRALLEIRMDGMPSIAQEIVIKKALPAGWSLGYDGGSWFRLVGPQYTFLTIRLMAPDGRLTLHEASMILGSS